MFSISTLILSLPPFTLRSAWLPYVLTGGTFLTYSEPRPASRTLTFSVSSLPAGAAVQSAVLTVSCALSGPGTFLVSGSPLLQQDLTSRLTPDGTGAYADLPVSFYFRAEADPDEKDHPEAAASVTRAELVIEYLEAGAAPAAPVSDSAPFLSAARSLLPCAVLHFPDGSRQALGPEAILSFRLDQGLDDGPLLGSACAAMLAIRLSNASREWYPGGALRGGRPLLGAWLSLSLRAGEQAAPVPLGAFLIEEMSGGEDDLFLELRGFDAMASLPVIPYTRPQRLGTMDELLMDAAAQAGLVPDGSLFCNGSVQALSAPASPDETVRDAIAHLCQAGGSFSCISPDGRLSVRPAVPPAQGPSVTPSEYLSCAHDERLFAFSHLGILPSGSGDGLFRWYSLDESDRGGLNTVLIRDNPLFPFDLPDLTDTLARGLQSAFTGACWRSMDLSWRWRPDAVPGARLTVLTRGGTAFSSLLTGQSLCWDGALRARSFCPVDTALPGL